MAVVGVVVLGMAGRSALAGAFGVNSVRAGVQAARSFKTIQFTEIAGDGGFESDNQAVAHLSSAPSGRRLRGTPEPVSLAMVGTGLLGAVLRPIARRRRERMEVA